MMTDGVNRMRLCANIKAMPLKGWGFTYYGVAMTEHRLQLRRYAGGAKPESVFQSPV